VVVAEKIDEAGQYVSRHFAVTDRDEIFAFVEANAFGQLISTVNGRFYASQLPFLVTQDRSAIICHLAKQNPQHLELDGREALVTLQGAHDYISPSWYAGPGVPTWNYQAVHIYGQCRVFHGADRLKEVVEALAHQYESAFADPWQPEYGAVMLTAIVGIEIRITDVQCKYKLSQNRSSQDRVQVVEKLKSLGSNKLAQAMERSAS
jgi:transcriptional regulator